MPPCLGPSCLKVPVKIYKSFIEMATRVWLKTILGPALFLRTLVGWYCCRVNWILSSRWSTKPLLKVERDVYGEESWGSFLTVCDYPCELSLGLFVNTHLFKKLCESVILQDNSHCLQKEQLWLAVRNPPKEVNWHSLPKGGVEKVD